MGNRAVITFATSKSAPCIYLHWNGGRASVEGFLRAARHLNLHVPLHGAGDPTRFDTQAQVLDAIAQVLARDFFKVKVGETVYRETYGSTDADNWDNGVYVIDADLEIVGRKFQRNPEEVNDEKTLAIYSEIIGNHATVEAAA